MTTRTASASLDEALGALGYDDPVVVERRGGTEARVARVDVDVAGGGREALAVKAFRVEPVLGLADVTREAGALVRFRAELDREGSAVAVTCPRVVVVLPEDGLLVTTWEQGRPLDEVLAGAGRPERRRLAELVVDGLVAFHRACGEPYGDAHPGNVLVDGHRLVLLDPTASDPHHRAIQTGVPPLVADLGYWLHSTTSQALGQVVRGRARLALARLRFARDLLDIAGSRSSEGAPGLHVGAVADVARRHLDRMPPTARGTAVRCAGRMLVAATIRPSGVVDDRG